MKNIFKKNQIIITALAIMIVIAGYISFTNKDKPSDTDVMGSDLSNDDYEVFSSTDDMDLATTTDTTKDTNKKDNNTTTDNTTTDNATTDKNDTTKTDEKKETPVDIDKTNTSELGDISEEDILETAKNVNDNGELESEEGDVTGEAVLANTTLNKGYFISSKIEREQLRARSKADLMSIIDNTKVSEETKKEATAKMLEIIDITSKENSTEKLLEAKGFDGVMVYIDDGKVEVVVNASNITDQQLAIIEDVVHRKTDIATKDININTAVVEE